MNKRRSLNVGASNNSNLDAVGRTPLMLAAVQGDTLAIRDMIAGGADVNACCYRNWTALQYAAREGRKDAAKLLLKAGG